MIDEKQLIEEVEKEYRSLCPNGESCHYPERFGCCYDKAISKVAEIINNQPKVGEWIPCSERLPELGEAEVIVTTSDGEVYGEMFYGYRLPDDKKPCFHRWDDEMYFCFRPDVAAWMPLPESYKGE